MTTENQNPLAVSLYDRMHDPLEGIKAMGLMFARSGFCGCDNEEQGEFLALTCMFERKSPLDILRRYHVQGGMLVPKTRYQLTQFRKDGGDHEWLTEANDAEKATVQLTKPNGKVCAPITVTIEEAFQSGVSQKSGSAWVKTPAIMLQVMALRRAIARYVPEYSLGDNIDESPEASAQQVEVESSPLPKKDPVIEAEIVPPPSGKPKSAKQKVAKQKVAKTKAPTRVLDDEGFVAPQPQAPPPEPEPEPEPPAPEPEEAPTLLDAGEAPVDWDASNVTDSPPDGPLNIKAQSALISIFDDMQGVALHWFMKKGGLKPGERISALAPARAAKILQTPDKFREVLTKHAQAQSQN